MGGVSSGCELDHELANCDSGSWAVGGRSTSLPAILSYFVKIKKIKNSNETCVLTIDHKYYPVVFTKKE